MFANDYIHRQLADTYVRELLDEATQARRLAQTRRSGIGRRLRRIGRR